MSLIKKSNNLVVIGNTLEFFDLYLYIHFAFLLSEKFFPSGFSETGFFRSFTFLQIYLIAPIACVCFGYVGDKVGRKRVILSTAMVMAVASFFVVFMPTYETWGETATILFLVLRVIQGVALAGEPTAANLYLFENSSLSRDDPWYTQAPWYCKVMGISEQVGGLFALLIGYIALHFFNDYVHGWRIPFVFCAVFVVFLAFMRKRLTESYDYQVASGNKEINMFAQNELRDFYKKIQFHRSSMVYWILLLLPYPIVFYMCFLQISPKVVSGTEELLLHNTYVSLGSILISLFSAYFPLRYKWNLRITVASCAIMGCLFAFMSIWCLENHYSFYMVYIFQILMMSLINFGLVMPALLKVFQTVGRYTFMTLGWAIARFTNFFLIVIVMKIIEDRFGLYGCLIFLYGIVGLALYAVYAHVSYYNMDIESIKRSIKKARTVEGVTVMSREEINEYMGNKG